MRQTFASLLSRAARWIAPKAITPAKVWGTSDSSWLDAFRRHRDPSASDLLNELRNTAWTCASINATLCATYAPHLYVATRADEPDAKCAKVPLRKGRLWDLRRAGHVAAQKALKVEEVTEHPMIDLLQRANPVHNQFDLLELTSLYLETIGCAYWLVEDGPLGVPESLWPLPAQHVQVVRDERGLVRAYRVRSSSQEILYDAANVIGFRFADPRDPYGGGLSPLRACYEQVSITAKYTSTKEAIYENRGLPSAIVSPAEVIGEDEARRYEEQWNQRFRQGGQGRVLVAESALKVELLKHQVGDLAELAEYGATKEDIANAFGVPLAYLTKDTNMANIQAAGYQHMMLGVRPRLRRRDEKLNEQLVPRFDPTGRLFFASEDPVPENQDQLLKQQESDLRNGVKTINEVREERGLPPVPWGNVPWMPLAWKPTDRHIAEQAFTTDNLDERNRE